MRLKGDLSSSSTPKSHRLVGSRLYGNRMTDSSISKQRHWEMYSSRVRSRTLYRRQGCYNSTVAETQPSVTIIWFKRSFSTIIIFVFKRTVIPLFWGSFKLVASSGLHHNQQRKLARGKGKPSSRGSSLCNSSLAIPPLLVTNWPRWSAVGNHPNSSL